MSTSLSIENKIECFHCGDICPDKSILIEEKNFCCTGCMAVYELLQENRLCNYYSLEERPGISPKNSLGKRFDYLDDESTIDKLLDFKDDKISSVTFSIPQMHCSSCIWLLENLFKINSAIFYSNVNFLKKQILLKFDHEKVSLKDVVILLTSLGYEPRIRLDSVEEKKEINSNKKLYMKLGVAAFSFGNIMLLSFPEYLSIDVSEVFYKKVFAYLNLILALPVFFYSSTDYFISAYKGLRKKIINLDVPISLGIIVLFFRSVFEVLSNTGAGYFDSLAGLLFFLLLGKVFQSKTYDALNFERDFKAYFPLSVSVKDNNNEISIPVSKLKIGDRIIIRNNEIIPADAILFKGDGRIDYSFVTGESKPVLKVLGELIYAGGRQKGEALELEVVKEVSQSYLTQLWNNDSFKKSSEINFTQFSNVVSKYFTTVILGIAFAAALVQLQNGLGFALGVFTSVLIIACPCALAMSTPFTLGNTLRIFGRNRFYLKNTQAVHELSKIDEIVFDKTGTITETDKAEIKYSGKKLSDFELQMLKTLLRNSTHPLSKKVYDSISAVKLFDLSEYKEYQGKGIEGRIYDNLIKAGALSFVSDKINQIAFENDNESCVYISINNNLIGRFEIPNHYREGSEEIIKELRKNYSLSLLSGDNNSEKENLKNIFGSDEKLLFERSPSDKLNYIKNIRQKNRKVLMIGDGLNDAGALSQSDVGISVTDDISNFSPACDAILDGTMLKKLPDFISFSKTSRRIIYASFAISFLYNFIGLSFAVQGMLSPIIAAVLMPLSSISVVVFATVTTNLFAKRKGL